MGKNSATTNFPLVEKRSGLLSTTFAKNPTVYFSRRILDRWSSLKRSWIQWGNKSMIAAWNMSRGGWLRQSCQFYKLSKLSLLSCISKLMSEMMRNFFSKVKPSWATSNRNWKAYAELSQPTTHAVRLFLHDKLSQALARLSWFCQKRNAKRS